VPFSPATLRYVAALDADADVRALAAAGLALPAECARVLRACTLLLQVGPPPHPPHDGATKVDTICTAPSLIPTVNGNTARSFSTHGQHPAAKGSSTTVSA
jgi:hypothetical protein